MAASHFSPPEGAVPTKRTCHGSNPPSGYSWEFAAPLNLDEVEASSPQAARPSAEGTDVQHLLPTQTNSGLLRSCAWLNSRWRGSS